MNCDVLLSCGLRAALVLAAGLASYALLSRAAAATRRFVLVVTLVAAIVVPVVAALGPRWTVEAPAAVAVFARASDGVSEPRAKPVTEPVVMGTIPRAAASGSVGRFDVGSALVLGWILIASALLVRAAASQLRARAIARRAKPIESLPWSELAKDATGRRVDVRVSSELDSPAVVGLLRATIVIPHVALEWPIERCRLVLAHELAHVQRRDVLAQAIADAACAFHWCNPLVWICARRLRIEREIAADDAVLSAGVRPSHYAEELLAVATSAATSSAALAMAERSSLETRIASILSARLARAPLAPRATVAVVTLSTTLAAAAACTSPERAVPSASQVTTPSVASAPGTANDALIQSAADEEISAIETQWSPALATILVLDSATGELLANAGRSHGKPADVASTVAIAPGSTLKPITIVAALEQRAIKGDQTFDCGPRPRMYGETSLTDHVASGTLDVTHILAVSSNIGMSRIFDALGGDNLGLWLRRFHFGETAGVVPAYIVRGTLQGALVAIGAGITATPLQMIGAYGAIADGGVYHAPTLHRGGSPAVRLFSAETAGSVMTMLEAAVEDGGTGDEARVDGVHVAGKTGTSQWTADGRDWTYASFIGVADLSSRRVVILVGIQAPSADGWYGGNSAAPAFARLVKHIRER